MKSGLFKLRLKYAVMRAVQCPKCKDILDIRRAVLVTFRGTSANEAIDHVVCCKCWDKSTKARPYLLDAASDPTSGIESIFDPRKKD